MNLTNEQIAAVKGGEPVTVEFPEIGAECVLLRADVFAKVKNLIYDDSTADPREHYEATLRAWDAEGSPQDADYYVG